MGALFGAAVGRCDQAIGQPVPVSILERHAAAAPELLARLDRHVVHDKTIGPGGEAAEAAVGVQTVDDREQGVGGRLMGEIVKLGAACAA
ncbi:MAG: hypothetical protein JO046_24015 [Solirubrobacterales bacterium]|nr:hypothetical protein [Solirubrobacterales bacterium]